MSIETVTNDADSGAARLDAPVEEPADSAVETPPTDAGAPDAESPDGESQHGLATRVKHGMLRAVDLAALGFLEPIVRLCFGDEPRTQLVKIARFVVLPVVAFVLFLVVWAWTAPNLKTKYGSLPTPSEVWRGWSSIMTFHDRETAKSLAYVARGEERQRILAAAVERRDLLDRASKRAGELVEEARVEERAYKDDRIAPLAAELEGIKQRLTTETAEKRDELAARSRTATALADRKALVEEAAQLADWEEQQRLRLSALKSEIKLIEDEKYRPVVEALLRQTAIDEERQFNEKIIEVAGDKSREAKLVELAQRIKADREALETAAPDETFELASSISRTKRQFEDVAASTYARPWTLPMQIVRSILTVFSGFLVGIVIAIPLGVLCGLSSTFMAMVTPFIALFKPVSPIVWLLIFWIIVGGIFPDPSQSPTLETINGAVNAVLSVVPFVNSIVDDIDINPAFIASALTVAMCSLWATMVNTALGVASVDKDHLNVARVLKLSPWDKLTKIVLPSALPLVFAGMRISLGIGWMVLIAAELLASSEGLGKFTNDMFQNGNTDSFAKIMVMVFVVGVIGLLLDRIMIVLQRLVTFDGSPTAL